MNLTNGRDGPLSIDAKKEFNTILEYAREPKNDVLWMNQIAALWTAYCLRWNVDPGSANAECGLEEIWDVLPRRFTDEYDEKADLEREMNGWSDAYDGFDSFAMHMSEWLE